jgi:CrcB protein
MTISVWVMVGSALGGLARYWLGLAVTYATGSPLPWGTLIINVIGSFVIGWFGALTVVSERLVVSPEIRIFVMVGLCGGFTTFSSFSLQTLELLRANAPGWAAANVLGSVGLCLLGVWAGFAAGR